MVMRKDGRRYIPHEDGNIAIIMAGSQPGFEELLEGLDKNMKPDLVCLLVCLYSNKSKKPFKILYTQMSLI